MPKEKVININFKTLETEENDGSESLMTDNRFTPIAETPELRTNPYNNEPAVDKSSKKKPVKLISDRKKRDRRTSFRNNRTRYHKKLEKEALKNSSDEEGKDFSFDSGDENDKDSPTKNIELEMDLLTSIIQREIEDKVIYKEVIDHGDVIPNRHVDCLSPQRKHKKAISTRRNKRRTHMSKRRTGREYTGYSGNENSGENSPKKKLDVSSVGIIYSSPKYLGE